MAHQAGVISDFNEITQDYWRTRGDYEHVNTLLLLWEEDDLNVDPEVQKLKQVLVNEFNYSTQIFRIPSEKPAAKLQHKLAEFIAERSLNRKSLTIIYYAGHSDRPDLQLPLNEGRSRWRAKSVGGPSLDWFEVQTLLGAAEGDVLIILDCCHAAQKTRDGKDTKMEVLAASGSGSVTPGPGRLSFTSVMIREIRKYLAVTRSKLDVPLLTVRLLHQRLFHERIEFGLVESPVYFDLSSADHPSIVLKPLEKKLPPGFSRKTLHSADRTSTIILKVSLVDDPTGLQLANWLKSYAPKEVQSVDIEGLVLKARRLQGLGEYKDLFPGSTLSKLSDSAQKEIAERLMELDDTVQNSVLAAKSHNQRSNTSVEGRSAKRAIEDISSIVNNVCETYQDSLLLDPNLNNRDSQQEMEVDSGVEAIEAGDLVNIQSYIKGFHKDLSKARELSATSIELTDVDSDDEDAEQRFLFGIFEGKRVMVEVFQYEPVGDITDDCEDNDQDHIPPKTRQQFSKMAALLSQPKRSEFHVLQCIGFTHLRAKHELRLVFELEKTHEEDEYSTLLELLKDPDVKRLPLGVRLQLAFSIATAVSNLHRVGWVHKDLRSDNIVLFGKTNTSTAVNTDITAQLDFSTPYLFGFEYSRPEDDETAKTPDFDPATLIYKHPDRWGTPTAYFTKMHDVYALGIMFVELAFWKPAAVFPFANPKRLKPPTFRNDVIKEVKKNLPHQVGSVFTEVIVSCLSADQVTQDMDALEAHKWFKKEVLGKLAQMVGRV